MNGSVVLSAIIRYWAKEGKIYTKILTNTTSKRIAEIINHKNPKLFFKYKSLNSIRQLKEVFEKDELFFPNRQKLNDPFEGMKTELNLHGVMGSSICLAGDVEYGFVSSERDKYRILSLSSDCFSPLMWAHYGDNYQGICFCFRTDKSFKKAKPVKYVRYDSLKHHKTIDEMDEVRAIIESDLYLKHTDWCYEHEWRITEKKDVIFEDDTFEREKPYYFSFDKSELVAVIWGGKADSKAKKELQGCIPAGVKQYRTHIGGQTGQIRLLPDSEQLNLDGSSNEFIDSLNQLYKRVLI